MRSRLGFMIIGLVLLIGAASCTLKEAGELPKASGFIEYRQDEGVISSKRPATYYWLNPELLANPEQAHERYTKIIIAPVLLDYLKVDDWQRSRSSFISNKEDYMQRVRELADFMNQGLQANFPHKKAVLELVQDPGPQTVLLEIAFREVLFGNPATSAAAFAAPLPGSSHLFDSMSSPMMSLEARATDSVTGEILMMSADRRFPRIRVVDLNSFTVMSPQRDIISRWVSEISESMKSRITESRRASSRFGILPW